MYSSRLRRKSTVPLRQNLTNPYKADPTGAGLWSLISFQVHPQNYGSRDSGYIILSPVSASFQVEAAGFRLCVIADENGIGLERGPFRQSIPYPQITGAIRISTPEPWELPAQRIPPELLSRLGGVEGLAKIQELSKSIGTIVVAYRDDSGRKESVQVPYSLADPAIPRELQSRLGSRWLGETANQADAEKRLKLGPGIFTTVVVALALLLIVALLAAMPFYLILAPALNILSIQKMLVNFQDGDYVAFGTSVFAYFAIFVMMHIARRVWRSRVTMRRRAAHPALQHLPFDPRDFK